MIDDVVKEMGSFDINSNWDSKSALTTTTTDTQLTGDDSGWMSPLLEQDESEGKSLSFPHFIPVLCLLYFSNHHSPFITK